MGQILRQPLLAEQILYQLFQKGEIMHSTQSLPMTSRGVVERLPGPYCCHSVVSQLLTENLWTSQFWPKAMNRRKCKYAAQTPKTAEQFLYQTFV